jgi:hypothetical protein
MTTNYLESMRPILLLALVPLALSIPAAAAAQGAEPPAGYAPPDADAVLFDEAARTAWAFVERNYVPETGWVRPLDHYPFATVWDLASGLAALFAARELGYLDPDEYDRRMARALATLSTADLYQGAVFNKSYSALTGRMVDRDGRATGQGHGWSATDLGRLLLWLRAIADHHPRHAAAAEAVAGRIDVGRVLRYGDLWGETVLRDGRVSRYPEGRIGYEQYAALGFSLWGHRAERALDLHAHAEPLEILGQRLYADRRGGDRLTSEPFVLLGLETGFPDPSWRELAEAVLAAQEERYRRTGIVTVVSEDAHPNGPYHFYYYSVYAHGTPFAVDAQGATGDLFGPRTVSAKASFGWHALFPSEYTRIAVERVRPARHEGGWGAGVDEASGVSVGSENVNTAAVILQAALHARRGGPIAPLR